VQDSPLDARLVGRLAEIALFEADDRDLDRFHGPTLGRYVLLHPLGMGAMGTVYAAVDPRLGRTVAVKLLRGASADARARMRREAEALARLSHPHVVQVYDVGEHDGRLYIAMELVAGVDLDIWLRTQPRSPQAVLAVFRQAALGLTAAHAAGLVHRDFKPSNALVDADEVLRLVDFGLVRASLGKQSSQEHHEQDWDPAVTHPGSLLGTPAYMPPEQHAGARIDARSDQFAWCAALYQALWQEWPFGKGTIRQLRLRKELEQLVPPPRGAWAPDWLWRLLQRGLRADPALRWPSMTAVIEQLDRGMARRSRGSMTRLWLWLGALAVANTIAWAAGAPSEPTYEPAPTAVEEWPLDLGPTVARTERDLARMLRSTGHFAAAEELLREAIETSSASGDDELAADAMADLMILLADDLGHPDEALEWRPHLQAARRRIGAPTRLDAKLHEALGVALARRGDHHAAREHIDRAIALRLQHGEHDTAELLTLRHHWVALQRRLDGLDVAITAGQAVLADRERLLGPSHPHVAASLRLLGIFHRERGDLRRAAESLLRALEVLEAAFGPHHYALAPVASSLGIVYLDAGRHDEALAALRRSEAIYLGHHGADHADLVFPLLGHAKVLLMRDPPDPAGALVMAARAKLLLRDDMHHQRGWLELVEISARLDLATDDDARRHVLALAERGRAAIVGQTGAAELLPKFDQIIMDLNARLDPDGSAVPTRDISGTSEPTLSLPRPN
jgi:tetratricopeptide (TPR) repeat protein